MCWFGVLVADKAILVNHRSAQRPWPLQKLVGVGFARKPTVALLDTQMLLNTNAELIQMRLVNPDHYDWAVEPIIEEDVSFNYTSKRLIRKHCEPLGFLLDLTDANYTLNGIAFHNDLRYFCLHLYHQHDFKVWDDSPETDVEIIEKPWVLYMCGCPDSYGYSCFKRFATREEILEYVTGLDAIRSFDDFYEIQY